MHLPRHQRYIYIFPTIHLQHRSHCVLISTCYSSYFQQWPTAHFWYTTCKLTWVTFTLLTDTCIYTHTYLYTCVYVCAVVVAMLSSWSWYTMKCLSVSNAWVLFLQKSVITINIYHPLIYCGLDDSRIDSVIMVILDFVMPHGRAVYLVWLSRLRVTNRCRWNRSWLDAMIFCCLSDPMPLWHPILDYHQQDGT